MKIVQTLRIGGVIVCALVVVLVGGWDAIASAQRELSDGALSRANEERSKYLCVAGVLREAISEGSLITVDSHGSPLWYQRVSELGYPTIVVTSDSASAGFHVDITEGPNGECDGVEIEILDLSS